MFQVDVAGYPVVNAVPSGTVLLDVCQAYGIPIDAACGGFAACNTCRVRCFSGDLGEVDEAELAFLDAPGQRLACQARVFGDVRVGLDPGA